MSIQVSEQMNEQRTRMRASYKVAERERNCSTSEEQRDAVTSARFDHPLSPKPVALIRSPIHMCTHSVSHSSAHSYIWMMINNTGCGDSLPGFKLWFCHVRTSCVGESGQVTSLSGTSFPRPRPGVGVAEFSVGDEFSYRAREDDAQE